MHGQDIEVAGMMTHGVIVGIDDAEVMKQTDSCQWMVKVLLTYLGAHVIAVLCQCPLYMDIRCSCMT